MPARILVVDDDPVQRRLLNAAVSRMGHAVTLAAAGEEALAAVASAPEPGFDAIILDLIMEGMDGLTVLARLAEREKHIPVIVQTAQGGIDVVVNAMRAGAFDFVVKPVSPERLRMALDGALKVDAVRTRARRALSPQAGAFTFRDIVCASPAMEKVMRIAEKASRSSIPVLIEGESGTGKELIARAIQGASDRRRQPFITVNCGALPANLAESILFGHEKGAFTGASDKHVGKFEEANGGTLFLDEIGELPADIQVKLLRALQEGEIDPVGARRPVKVDIRIVSATNRTLLDEVKAGRFREDLYYRLSVLPIMLPPLRARRADIPLLIRHFLERMRTGQGSPATAVSPEAEAILVAYDWPGNIRELENAIFRATVLAETATLGLQEFPQIAAQMPGFRLPEPEPLPVVEIAPEIYSDLAGADPAATSNEATLAGTLRLVDVDGHVRPFAAVEEEMIRFAIDYYKGRMTQVARRLGIGRSTLYRKLKDYGIDADA
jgi:DNA-binding NtrC family response regulator